MTTSMREALAIVSDQDSEFLRDVVTGLTAAEQKTIPCKYLYDEVGSRFFEAICETRDYYLTRTEFSILRQRAAEMAQCIGPQALLIEPGAGACEKAPILLDAMTSPSAFVPLDISEEMLLASCKRLTEAYPRLTIRPRVCDFTRELPPLDPDLAARDDKSVIFFPGSTIGNFEPQHAAELLHGFRQALQPGDGLLLGADLVKDAVVLERAYHDAEHVTESFNLNLLTRINRELGADFDPTKFSHRAFYHPTKQRVEMHLVSLEPQSVTVGGHSIDLADGETIHTENSHKYTLEQIQQLLADCGFAPRQVWTDERDYFSVHYAEAA